MTENCANFAMECGIVPMLQEMIRAQAASGANVVSTIKTDKQLLHVRLNPHMQQLFYASRIALMPAVQASASAAAAAISAPLVRT